MNPRIALWAACTGGMLAAGAAQAQSSPWIVRLGPAHVGFSTRADVSVAGSPVPGGSASASSNTTLGLEFANELSSRWTARLLLGVPPETTLSGTGTLASAGELGKVTYAPAVLSMTFNLLEGGTFRPYLGAGLNYTMVFKSKDAFITQLDVKNAFAPVAQAGVEFTLSPDWRLSIDARKIYLKTKADGVLPAMGGAPAHADVRLNPLVVFASVGRRF